MKKENKEELKYIWVFTDENGKTFPFRTFDAAHKYAFEVYDKDLKFSEKGGETYFYTNSWNDEDVTIHKIDLRELIKNEKRKSRRNM